MPYSVDPKVLKRLNAQLNLLRQAINDPAGSLLDPEVTEQTFASLLDAAAQSAGSPLTDQYVYFEGPDPEEFLYLTLPREVLDRPLSDLKLPPRWEGILNRKQIVTIEDLLERSEAELRAVRNLGDQALEAINQTLAARGWHLSRHDQELAPPPGDHWIEVAGWRLLASRLPHLPLDRLCARGTWVTSENVFNVLVDLKVKTVGQLLELGEAGLQRLPWASRPPWLWEPESQLDQPFEPATAITAVNEWLHQYGYRLPS